MSFKTEDLVFVWFWPDCPYISWKYRGQVFLRNFYDGVSFKIFHGNYKNLAILFNILEKKSFFENCSVNCSLLRYSTVGYFYNVTLLTITLTHNDQCSPSYRNQSIDLHCKSVDWFLYDEEHWSLMNSHTIDFWNSHSYNILYHMARQILYETSMIHYALIQRD